MVFGSIRVRNGSCQDSLLWKIQAGMSSLINGSVSRRRDSILYAPWVHHSMGS